LLRRANLALRFVTDQLEMLEQMSPWDYQEVRRVLGHGSGFDSPGFNRVKEVTPPLVEAVRSALAEAGLDSVGLYQGADEHEDLYQLTELVVEWDERVCLWRVRHLKVVERIIGGQTVGTQGTPVEMLAKLINHSYVPDLWEVRNRLTAIAGTSPPVPGRADHRGA
ncbi:MAG: tryptophan 2,3-dioxygenase family protein, partial [Acidimicrobiia bacterium]